MQEVFISYSRLDALLADQIAGTLRGAGFSVWMDTTNIVEGRVYDRQIETALRDARCAIVLWSLNSIDSEWVRNEAAEAHRSGKLLPIMIDASLAPLQFRSVQSIDFRNWDGTATAPQFRQLAAALRRLMSAPAINSQEAAPQTAIKAPRTWRSVVAKLGLSFEDRETERRFAEFYFDQNLQHARMLLLILAALYGMFGFFEAFGGAAVSNGLALIIAPILVVAFLITLWPALRRFWRPVLLGYGVVTMAAVVAAMIPPQSSPTIFGGYDISMAVLGLLAFYGLAPFPFAETVIVCAIPAIAGWRASALNIDDGAGAALVQIIVSVYLMCGIAAWFREQAARRHFMETRVGRASAR